MANTPLVSVVMPLYNKRPYVKRAIDSIQQQTFSDWELIIVDDGSTDGSASEIPCDDPRIRFFQQQNAGPGAARNRGIRMALGKFVTFIDADDYYYPQKLEQEITLLQKKKMAEWMISAHHREEGDQITVVGVQDIHGRDLQTPVQISDNALSQLSIPIGCAVDSLCIKRDLILQLKGFNEKMLCYEIAELIIRCAIRQPKVIIYCNPLCRVVKVHDSAFNISSHRVEGLRQLGESTFNLSGTCLGLSALLTRMTRKNFILYTFWLIYGGKRHEARNFLAEEFPYSFDKKCWILWIATFQPKSLIRFVMSLYRKVKA